MSKQESSKKNERPPIYDKWDADACDGAACSSTVGRKEYWQKYPCIVGHSKDYALIAFSEDTGKIVDTEGRTVEECDPRIHGHVSSKYDFNIIGWECVNYPADRPEHVEYLFWKAKYPELLTR